MMKKTKWMALSAMFVAITVVFSQISFPIPGTPIVFTMGIMAVMLTGCMLPKGYAFLALLVYLLLGVCGLPVFSSFGSGLGTLLGYTGGFLMTYPIMAFLTAWLWELSGTGSTQRKKACTDRFAAFGTGVDLCRCVDLPVCMLCRWGAVVYVCGQSRFWYGHDGHGDSVYPDGYVQGGPFHHVGARFAPGTAQCKAVAGRINKRKIPMTTCHRDFLWLQPIFIGIFPPLFFR